MLPPVFLLSGWSTAGKDSVGAILQSEYGVQRLAFADVLKEMVAEEFQFPVEWAHSEEGKLKRPLMASGRTVRDLLISRGQGIRVERNDPGFFARLVAEKIKQSTAPIVITDWRLRIELRTLEEELQNPIHKVRIFRNGLHESPIQHSTEMELDEFRFEEYIQNPGTTHEELKAIVKKVLEPKLYFYIVD
jgi:hypothetical protein